MNLNFVLSVLQTVSDPKTFAWKFAFFPDGVTGFACFLWKRDTKEEAPWFEHENFVVLNLLAFKSFGKDVSNEAKNFGVRDDGEDVEEVDAFFGEVLINLGTALDLVYSGIALNHFVIKFYNTEFLPLNLYSKLNKTINRKDFQWFNSIKSTLIRILAYFNKHKL